MNQKAIFSKLGYFAWILFFMLSCLALGLFMYVRTSTISLVENLQVTIEGENGSARVVSIENTSRQNSEFFSRIEYQAYPVSHLSNGQMITITASTSEDLLRQFRMVAGDLVLHLEVQGLTEEPGTIVLQSQASSE